MAPIDSFVNPNAARIATERARETLAWNLHNVYFHMTLTDEEKDAMAAKLLATAREQFGDSAVQAALDALHDQLKKKVVR